MPDTEKKGALDSATEFLEKLNTLTGQLTPLIPIGGLLLRAAAAIFRKDGNPEQAQTYEDVAAAYDDDLAAYRTALDDFKAKYPEAPQS